MNPFKKMFTWITVILMVLFIITRCENEFQRLILISTNDVVNITAVSAKASGTIFDVGEGIKEYGHCWSTQDKPDIHASKTDLGSRKETGGFNSTLEDLDPNEKYYVRAYASDGSTVFYGKTTSFTTQDFTTPVVQTGTVDELTPTSASVTGNLTDLGNGIDIVSQHGHCWSTGPSPTTADDKTELGSTTSTGEYISSLSSLEDSTKYYVRAYATNEKGTAYGSVISFMTPGYFPLISGDTLEILSSTSVKITSYLAYLGPDNIVTSHGHCWATHDQPGISDNTTDLGSTTTTGTFFSTLSDLTEGEVYYATSYATNSYGTAYGAVIPFVAGDPALLFINDPNLVAYFPFSGTAEDFGPLGIDGIISGALFTADRNGISNSAVSFDGVNDKITCGDNDRNITNTVSISVWVKTTATVGGHIVSKYDGKNDRGWIVQIGSINGAGLYGRNTGGEFARAETSLKFNDNQWHNLIGIIDSNSFKLWVDGNLVGEDELYASTPDLTNNDQLGIGHWALGDLGEHYYYNGIIDDVLIFNRVLTSEEITILSTSKR